MSPILVMAGVQYFSKIYTNWRWAVARYLHMEQRKFLGKKFTATAWAGMAVRLRVCCWAIDNQLLISRLRFMAETCDINAHQAILEKLGGN